MKHRKRNIIKYVFFPVRICGIPRIQPVVMSKKRIVGGVEVVANAWLWQVSLQKDSKQLHGKSNTTYFNLLIQKTHVKQYVFYVMRILYELFLGLSG